ncbi:hypothetical protein EDB83DRAFT_2538625 [Lactarius deliciosus]|nr:hypothetical protein EDB83DRAFT_2538625 [Lactarius deliciosus]
MPYFGADSTPTTSPFDFTVVFKMASVAASSQAPTPSQSTRATDPPTLSPFRATQSSPALLADVRLHFAAWLPPHRPNVSMTPVREIYNHIELTLMLVPICCPAHHYASTIAPISRCHLTCYLRPYPHLLDLHLPNHRAVQLVPHILTANDPSPLVPPRTCSHPLPNSLPAPSPSTPSPFTPLLACFLLLPDMTPKPLPPDFHTFARPLAS